MGEEGFRAEAVPVSRVAYLDYNGTMIEEVRFWGSTVTPWLYDLAFIRNRRPTVTTLQWYLGCEMSRVTLYLKKCL